MSDRIDFQRLAAAALARSESLVPEWLPGGHKAGYEWKCINPNRADQREGSFSINLVTGKWGDFACDDKGGDLVALYAYLFCGDDQVEAAKALADVLGMPDAVPPLKGKWRAKAKPAAAPAAPAPEKAEPAKAKAAAWEPVTPVPAEAPQPPAAHEFRGIPSSVWKYFDAAGQLLGYVCRFTTSDGGKEVLPLTWCRHPVSGKGAWKWQQWSEPRPMYGLDRLAARPDAPVLLVEGEKCADAPGAAGVLAELVAASWPGGGKAVGKVDWSPLAGRSVIIWPDCDAQREKTTKGEKEAGVDPESKPILPEEKQPGVKTAEQIAAALLALDPPARVRIVKIPAPGEKPGGWDVADAIAEGMDDAALKAFVRNQRPPAAAAAASAPPAPRPDEPPPAEEAGASRPEWMRGMIWKGRGQLEECRENVFLILTQHPAWQGVIGWDDFARRVVKLGRTPTGGQPGEWTPEDDMELGLWMAQRLKFLVKGEGVLTAGVGMAASRNKFHPVRDWLQSLPPWDRVPRLAHWLKECMGAVAESEQYLELVGRIFLVGMVARVMQPGCKWDYMPIFEGPQGRGKSTALRVIGGQWFADTQLHIGEKDAYMQLDGVWLYEIGEMDSFNRSETTAVKAFVTTQTDRYREPYARRIIERPRQVAFGGTTNQGEYFKDTTGNRRFWPVRCRGRIDLDKLAEWREQLFAEALQLYREGVLWRPTREEEAQWIRPEQEAREIVDPWLVPLQDFLYAPDRKLNNENEFTSYALLTQAIGMDPERIDGNRSAATRIGNLMARLGWPKRRQGAASEGRRDWVYVRPEAAKPASEPTAARPAQTGVRPAAGPATGPGFDPVGF